MRHFDESVQPLLVEIRNIVVVFLADGNQFLVEDIDGADFHSGLPARLDRLHSYPPLPFPRPASPRHRQAPLAAARSRAADADRSVTIRCWWHHTSLPQGGFA